MAAPHRTLQLSLLLVFGMIFAACGGDDRLDLDIGDRDSGVLVPIDGLAVLLNGDVDGDRVCPWGTQPCVTVDQDLGSGRQAVTVAFADGIATVVQTEPVEDSFRANLVDRCDDTLPETDFLAVAELPAEEQEAAEADGTYAYDTLGQYILTIPDSYAVRWLSTTQRVHLGVVGDAEPHRTALDELGLGNMVCVAGGFTATDAELEQVQNDVGSMLEGWAPRNEGAGWGRDAFAGAVVVDIYEVDAAMLAESEDRFGERVELAGGFVVFNGSLDELHEQLELNASGGTGSAGEEGAPGLAASCGSIEFPTMPPDPGALPPLDDEAQAVFDDFLTGPYAVEAEFVGGNDMRIAERTDDTLVLLGIGDEGYVDVAFERRGGVWSPRNWGGCNIQVSAAGFGSAVTALDPDVEPDPDSTTLHLTINELNCASGQAPVDRDVVPVVVEFAQRIEITTLVAPVAGDADCPGNPWFPVVVELDQPLGDRVVVDMVEPPGTELTWPPLLDR